MQTSSQKSTYATKDANGNLTSKANKTTLETTTYQYDVENQLISVVRDQGSVVSYKYDGLGRRIKKNVNGVITRYIYDNEDILQELDTQNSILATYTHGPGIDEPISMNRGGQTYFYHTDGLGSIRQLTNSTGQVVESYSYTSFGLPTIYNSSHIPIPSSLLGNPYTYTGREFDSESGLYYYRARYYDPKIGRFLEEDPSLSLYYLQKPPLSPIFRILSLIESPQSLHPYVYVENDPITLLDPFGLSAKKEPCWKSACFHRCMWTCYPICWGICTILTKCPMLICPLMCASCVSAYLLERV